MDDDSQPGPPLDEADLIERIKHSMAQAERGLTVAGEDVLAAAQAFHEQHFGQLSPYETAQLADIEAGLRDADAGDFASQQEIEAVLEKYRIL